MKRFTIFSSAILLGAFLSFTPAFAEDKPAAEKDSQDSKDKKADDKDKDKKKLPQVLLKTNKGEILLELYEDEAPNTVANFVSLVEKKFYDGLKFHRVIADFMAQGGDPKGIGSGGPGYTIKCECTRKDHRKHERGVISMAHAGPDTGGSQFFITFRATPHLDGKHTVFGHVIKGMDVVDKLKIGDVIETATVKQKRDHEYKPEVNKESR